MLDNFIHKGRRKKLVEIIKSKGITDERVLEAIGKVPRHLFMESFLDNVAYEDRAQPISAGQTISQPYTVAFQTQLLDLKKAEKVLEVGTGSGYQTAVLLEMGVKVFSIERQRMLYEKTRLFLPKLGYFPTLFWGDGYKGKSNYAPFDKILITAGAPFVPPDLLQQLKIGGILVAPVGEIDQIMISVLRTSPTDYKQQEHGYFRFVPLIEGVND
jgi:protein-L-isoaspartate(D-aspartate) O-methyltransferase